MANIAQTKERKAPIVSLCPEPKDQIRLPFPTSGNCSFSDRVGTGMTFSETIRKGSQFQSGGQRHPRLRREDLLPLVLKVFGLLPHSAKRTQVRLKTLLDHVWLSQM